MDNTWAAVISVIGTLLAMIIGNILKKSKANKERIDIVGRVIESSNKIYPVLWSMMSRLRAKRAAIVQFHNGGKYYSGKSIDRLTMTHEVHDDLVPSVKDSFVGVMLDHYNKSLDETERNEFCYYPTLESVKDSSLQNVMKYYGTNSMLIMGVRDKRGTTVAGILVSFSEENPIDSHEIEAMLLQSNKIRDIINNN